MRSIRRAHHVVVARIYFVASIVSLQYSLLYMYTDMRPVLSACLRGAASPALEGKIAVAVLTKMKAEILCYLIQNLILDPFIN